MPATKSSELTNHPDQTRILFVQHSSICDQYGGVEYYLHDLVNLAVGTQGADAVRSVIALRSGRERTLPYAAKFVRFSNHKILGKLENRFSPRLLLETERTIKAFAPHLLVASHVSLGPLAYLLRNSFKLPYLVCVYGIDCWGDLWPQDEWCLKKADGIISISHWTKKILVDRGIPAANIHIVQPRLPPSLENVPPVVRTEKKELTLLTVSRLEAKEQYKGQDHVLHALAKLREEKPHLKFRYIIQGEGTDQPRLEALSRDLKLETTVEFKGRVPDREALHDLYKSADLYVMPSRFGRWGGSWKGEGFGIVYLEAASFGLPSVAYDCGGATDIIKSGVNGILVEPDNIAALAETLAKLNTDRSLIKAMGEKAKALTEANFTEAPIREQWKTCIEQSKKLAFPSGVTE